MPFPRPRDTSVVFIARRMPDGSGNDGYHNGARERPSWPASPSLFRLPFAATCFEFTSMCHEESLEVEEASHYAERSFNSFLSSTISSIRFNVGFVKSLDESELKWKVYGNPIRVCFVCSALILLLLLLLLLLSLLLSLLSLLMRMRKYNGEQFVNGKWNEIVV